MFTLADSNFQQWESYLRLQGLLGTSPEGDLSVSGDAHWRDAGNEMQDLHHNINLA